MTRLLPRRVPRFPLSTLVTALATVLIAGLALLVVPTTAAAEENNPRTPRHFTGFGFDQCMTQDQRTMDRWLQRSPYMAVGVYISGNSRWCRDQPNLTPRWVSTQLRKGWRILPITLGPQASCHPGFPRYNDDPKINPNPGSDGWYGAARKMGRQEARKTIRAADRLGFRKGSTLWYDLEGFDFDNTHCRESALAFLSAYNRILKKVGDFKPGLYSSAASGIKMVDNARVWRPGTFHLPKQIWIADWDGKANTSSEFVRPGGWRKHFQGRVKQYRGGHNETWGGKTINIDSNRLRVGRGSIVRQEPEHCGGVRLNYRNYRPIPWNTGDSRPGAVRVLQCMLTKKGYYSGPINATYTPGTRRAVRQYKADHGIRVRSYWSRSNWVSVLSLGTTRITKIGVTGPSVRRVQRALNAAQIDTKLRVTGVYNRRTAKHMRAYQRRHGVEVNGVANSATWPLLFRGRR